MLDSLYVKNLALIDEEEVTFTEGLNVLSGETGAGKSILIGSVLIALGAKVHKEMIRANEKEAYIELIFSPTHPAVLEKLREYDIEPEDGQLIISKKITASKSVSKINKEAYPASKVREVASLLLDVHGQHDHQALIHQHKQLEIVDRSGGKKLKEAKEQTAGTTGYTPEFVKKNEEIMTNSLLYDLVNQMYLNTDRMKRRRIKFSRQNARLYAILRKKAIA